MNNEQEIERMAKAVDYVIYQYSSDPNTPPDNNLSECIAYDLIVRGYGNVKQAVREFLYKIENLLVKQENRYSRLCASKRTLLNLHKQITKFYGADE